MMGCCNCFGFSSKPKGILRPRSGFSNCRSLDFLLIDDVEDEDVCSYNGDATSQTYGDESETQSRVKISEAVLHFRTQNGLICRQCPVKETNKLVRTEDENGNKLVNQYVRERKIGAGSYGKVALYKSLDDGKHYAIKSFHKSHLSKRRVAPSETAMTDVLREVLIMKMLEHPNIVNLIEVIDDPESDDFYMVLEYVEGKWVCQDSGPGVGEIIAQKYLRDIISGLMYLHAHIFATCLVGSGDALDSLNIVHGDIKPDNLLITQNGTVKIGDFSVSQVFEDDNDELRRSPGTPVFTAPECCLGLTYHGKAADTWAVGVTLYCMVLGHYPFLGDTLQDTYDKIVNNPLILPDGIHPQLRNLLEGILCKDPGQRMTLNDISEHSWVIGNNGPIPQYLCWCKKKSSSAEESSFQSEENTQTKIELLEPQTDQIGLS